MTALVTDCQVVVSISSTVSEQRREAMHYIVTMGSIW